MAIVITPGEIKDFCPTSASDATIQIYIDLVVGAYGDCLESNYTPETAKALSMMAVCIMLSNATNSSGTVKSKRAPNGASTSYETKDDLGGMYSNIEALDTANCLLPILQSDGVFALGTAGSNLNNTNGCC